MAIAAAGDSANASGQQWQQGQCWYRERQRNLNAAAHIPVASDEIADAVRQGGTSRALADRGRETPCGVRGAPSVRDQVRPLSDDDLCPSRRTKARRSYGRTSLVEGTLARTLLLLYLKVLAL